MATAYTVTLTHEALDDLRRLEAFAIAPELAREAPDWTTLERALEAIRVGLGQRDIAGAVRHQRADDYSL